MLKQYLNKGISTPRALFVILVLASIVGAFTLWQYSEIQKKETNLPEVKIPDKTTVLEKEGTFTQPEESTSTIESTSTQEIDTSNWKTYRNEEYGFEIRYPDQFSISEFYISKKEPPISVFFSSEDKNYFRGFIGVEVLLDQKSEKECVSINEKQRLLSYKGEKNINSTVFYHFANYPKYIGAYCGMSGGCTYLDIYRTFHNHHCYQIKYDRRDREFIEGNPYDPHHKIIGDVKEIPALFNQMLSTFRFLE